MDPKQFDLWVDMLLDEGLYWAEIGVSNEYCNSISVPKYGLKLKIWSEMAFEVTDEKKYMFFLLRY